MVTMSVLPVISPSKNWSIALLNIPRIYEVHMSKSHLYTYKQGNMHESHVHTHMQGRLTCVESGIYEMNKIMHYTLFFWYTSYLPNLNRKFRYYLVLYYLIYIFIIL